MLSTDYSLDMNAMLDAPVAKERNSLKAWYVIVMKMKLDVIR